LSFPDSAQILAATRIISLSKANFNLFMLLRDSNSAFSAYQDDANTDHKQREQALPKFGMLLRFHLV